MRHVAHLARRFFGFLLARPLSPAEQAQVHALLDPGAESLFWAQQPQDQRHAFEVAARVRRVLPGDREATQAALLHDVGKQHSRLGPIQRSLATVLDAVGGPMTSRQRAYRAHGSLGAADLDRAGCSSFVVEFARVHPSDAPEGFDRDRWTALLFADDA